MGKKQVYSNLKIFHYQEKIDSLSKSNLLILPPTQIRIKPINACNHRCSYCCYRTDNLELGKDMNVKDMIPREKMSELLDDIIEMQVKAVTFSGGGEPLIYPYIIDALKKLAGSNVKFATLTNGSKLTGEAAEIFASHGSWVRVSIDGWDNASYANYRDISDGEFTKVLFNLKQFSKIKGKCRAGAVIIIDKKNVNHIYELAKKLHDCGIDSIKMSPCIISSNWQENDNYHKEFFDEAQREINRVVSDFSSNHFEVLDTYHLLGGRFNKEYKWCPYIQICPVIGADCNVYTCHDKAYDLSSGLIFSIQNTRFKQAWYSDKNQYFKINPHQDCRHHCVVNTKNEMILEYLNIEHVEFV